MCESGQRRFNRFLSCGILAVISCWQNLDSKDTVKTQSAVTKRSFRWVNSTYALHQVLQSLCSAVLATPRKLRGKEPSNSCRSASINGSNILHRLRNRRSRTASIRGGETENIARDITETSVREGLGAHSGGCSGTFQNVMLGGQRINISI
jgi:hypothetical protein